MTIRKFVNFMLMHPELMDYEFCHAHLEPPPMNLEIHDVYVVNTTLVVSGGGIEAGAHLYIVNNQIIEGR